MISTPGTIDVMAIWTCLVIAVAASSVSITITQTELFAPLRKLMQKAGHMIGYLFQCFYCMKHWVVAALILMYQPVLIHSSFLPMDLAVSWFFTVTISSFVSGVMFKVFLLAMGSKIKEKELMALMAQGQEKP